jgi:hypothetical protein
MWWRTKETPEELRARFVSEALEEMGLRLSSQARMGFWYWLIDKRPGCGHFRKTCSVHKVSLVVRQEYDVYFWNLPFDYSMPGYFKAKKVLFPCLSRGNCQPFWGARPTRATYCPNPKCLEAWHTFSEALQEAERATHKQQSESVNSDD